MHHLIIDRWSTALIMQELTSIYEMICRHQPIDLPALRPFGDYIGWLKRQNTEHAEAYWRRTLGGFTSPTALSVDKRPGAMAGGRMPERRMIRLSEETSSGLQSLARQHRFTLSTLFQGAWAVLLSGYSGEEDVLFGVTVSGRPPSLSGVESMVGMFINSLPVRVKVTGSSSLSDWLQDLQAQVSEMQEYEHNSLGQIQRWSEIPQGVPMFESLVVVQNTPTAQPHDEIVNTGKSTLRLGTAVGDSSGDFPLFLQVMPHGRIRLVLNYDDSRYDDGDVQRMLAHLQAVLEAMVQDPRQLRCNLPRLNGAERLTEIDRQSLDEHERRMDEDNRQRLGRRTRAIIGG
jgi:microcystin synthetase protein McyB